MTILVNVFGAPGAGKSTLAAGIFYTLKKERGLTCELVTEYAKDLVWANRVECINDQIAIFGEQWSRVSRLIGKVDIVVTDSPVLLQAVYSYGRYPEDFERLILWCHERTPSFNLFLPLSDDYEAVGRRHDQEGARVIERLIQSVLARLRVPYYLTGREDASVDACLAIRCLAKSRAA